jgi:16S rRNA (guanine527-N7)-methyltransferase
MSKLSTSRISLLVAPYWVHADQRFCEQIQIYIETILAWNRKISLTTVTDPTEIVKFHFGESIFASSVVPMRVGRLADVGSGAGFPGIPLKMAHPELELTLIESNIKKCAFMSEVVRKLDLSRVTVVHSRMQNLPADAGRFDFITARALGNHAGLLSWAKGRLSAGGKLVLWLGEEGADAISRETDWDWNPPVLILGSKKRHILFGSPKA